MAQKIRTEHLRCCCAFATCYMDATQGDEPHETEGLLVAPLGASAAGQIALAWLLAQEFPRCSEAGSPRTLNGFPSQQESLLRSPLRLSAVDR